MKQKQIALAHVGKVGILGLAWALSGCSGALPEDENLDAVSQAFGSSSCGSAAADQTFTGKIDPTAVSPSTYNTCYKGYVVDVNNLATAYTGPGGGGGYDAHLSASWQGSVPTTQAACEAAWARAIFYKNVGGAWVDQTGNIDSYGTWYGGIIGCQPPEVTTLGALTLVSGASYRIAATMRTSYAGSNLRAVGFKTEKRLVIQ
jgi:hypothetical protein